MAPRKTAGRTAADEDPSELIITYLVAQNRPYSATEISSNLHNKVTKAKTDKILKELHEKGEIAGHTSGKSTVYWCLQNSKDECTTQDLATMDSSIADLHEAIPLLKAELKSKSAYLATLRTAPTTGALRETVANLERRKAEMAARLQALSSGNVEAISQEEKDRAEADFRKWKRKSMIRKKCWEEAEAVLLEGLSKEELYDKLGLDEGL